MNDITYMDGLVQMNIRAMAVVAGPADLADNDSKTFRRPAQPPRGVAPGPPADAPVPATGA